MTNDARPNNLFILARERHNSVCIMAEFNNVDTEETLLLPESKNGGAPTASQAAPARPVSLRTGVPLDRTVAFLLKSPNPQDNDRAIQFLRKVLALLVLQYAAVLMIISPFCLIDDFKKAMSSFIVSAIVATISFFGLVGSVILVARKGHEHVYARISLFSLTFFFAIALGAKLCLVSWSNYALIAVGQATANFALILAVLQFDSSSLKWLSHKRVMLLSLAQSSMWILVFRELGESRLVSITVPLAGWLYAVSVIMNVRKAAQHREPHDFLQATIFILGPPIPTFLIPKRRGATQHWTTLKSAVLLGAAKKKQKENLQAIKEDESLRIPNDESDV